MLNAELWYEAQNRRKKKRERAARDMYLLLHMDVWTVFNTYSPKIKRETRMKISLRRRRCWVSERWHISKNFNLNSSSQLRFFSYILFDEFFFFANKTRWEKQILKWCGCSVSVNASMECVKLFTYFGEKQARRFKYYNQILVFVIYQFCNWITINLL